MIRKTLIYLIFVLSLFQIAEASIITADLLVAHQFENTLNDSRNYLNLTPTLPITWIQGKHNTAINFSNGYAVAQRTLGTTGERCLSFWYYNWTRVASYFIIDIGADTYLRTFMIRGDATNIYFGGGNAGQEFSASVVDDDFVAKEQWQHIVFSINATGVSVWLNGSKVYAATPANFLVTSIADQNMKFAYYITTSPYSLDEMYIYNASCTDALVNELWNGGAGTFYDSITPGASINISASFPADQSNISSNAFNINLSMNASNPTNCSLLFGAVINQSLNYTAGGVNILVNYNVTVPDGNVTYLIKCIDGSMQVNSSSKTLFIDGTAPVINSSLNAYNTGFLLANFSVTDLHIKNITIRSTCNVDVTNSSPTNATTYYRVNVNISNCSYGQQYINVTAWDTFGSLTNAEYSYNNMNFLNITAQNAVTSAYITTFLIYQNGSLIGNTTDGFVYVGNLTDANYNYTIVASGFGIEDYQLAAAQTQNFYTYQLYGSNSVTITIRDEGTSALILQNVTLSWSGNNQSWQNVTSTGSIYVYDLNVTTYQIIFSSSGYGNRVYSVTIGNSTHQTLNAYLVASTTYTVFTVSDFDTDNIIIGATMTMYRYINGSWQTVESKNTDITGKAQFSYQTLTDYRFYVAASGYEDYLFYLTPILYDSYDVKLTRNISLNYSADFDGVNIYYAPGYFLNGLQYNFSMIFSSPEGTLLNYGLQIFSGTQNWTNTGSNSIGSELITGINVTALSLPGTVLVHYYYETAIRGLKEYTLNLEILTNATANNNTMIQNRDKTYGLGILERLLIVTLIIIIVVGISAIIGQIVAGLGLALFIYGFMYYIGFIPLWTVLITIFGGIIYVMIKTGG